MYLSSVVVKPSGTSPVCWSVASDAEEKHGEDAVWKDKRKSFRGNKGMSVHNFGLPLEGGAWLFKMGYLVFRQMNMELNAEVNKKQLEDVSRGSHVLFAAASREYVEKAIQKSQNLLGKYK